MDVPPLTPSGQAMHLPRTGLSPGFRAELERRCVDGTTGVVADLDALAHRYAVATDAAATHDIRLLCAVKASTQPDVLALAAEHGLGFDVANADELALVRAVAPEAMVSLTSPALPLEQRPELFSAFTRGRVHRWHCDSLGQLEQLCSACPGTTVGVRVNLDGLDVPPGTPVWQPSRFGIPLERLADAAAIARAHGCSLRWLHSHNGSEENTTDSFVFAAERIVDAARRAGLDLGSLDLGGGVFADATPDSLGELFGALRRTTGPDVELLLEPGRWWLTDCVCLVTRVLDIKETSEFVALVLDLGLMSHLQWSDFLRLPTLAPPEPGEGRPWRVCGRTCFEEDWLDESERIPVTRDAPQPRVGDLVVLGNVSGYSIELSCRFNGVDRQTMTVVRPSAITR